MTNSTLLPDHLPIEPLTRPSTGSVHLGMDHQPIRRFLVSPGPGDLGWRPHYMFYQPELEAFLRERAADRVEVETGWTCTGFAQDDSGVATTLLLILVAAENGGYYPTTWNWAACG